MLEKEHMNELEIVKKEHEKMKVRRVLMRWERVEG